MGSAPAPAALASPSPYNTLPANTDPASLSAMVVEMLLTGQGLYPFREADQYAIASTVNSLLSGFPHMLELSNIGVRARSSANLLPLPLHAPVASPTPRLATDCCQGASAPIQLHAAISTM